MVRDDLVEAPAQLDDLAGVDLDVGRLARKPEETWWIRIFAFGSAIRLPFAPPARRSAPIDIAIPTQIVDTSGLMNCIVS